MLDKKTTKYNPGDLLAVTIKPDDKIQGSFNVEPPSARMLSFNQYYHEKLARLMGPKDSHPFDYWFRLEISEPIGDDVYTNPRMHLHGVVRINSKYGVFKWLMDVIPDLLIHARLQIGHITDLPGWLEYCTKQQEYIPKGMALLSNCTHNPRDWKGPGEG